MKNLKIKHRTQHLPLAFTGLSLGLGGLGNCLALLCSQNGYNATWISYITISIVILIILVMLARNIMHPKILNAELNEPLSVTLVPTFSMSLMLIGAFIASFSKIKTSGYQIVGSIVMILAILIQCILIVYFFRSIVKNHIKAKNNPAYGSYFVPTVGLITACTVATKFTLLPALFFQIIWFIGFTFYIISFPFVTYAILFKAKADVSKFPTIAIWFAPTNLTPAGFIVSFLFNNHDAYYSQQFLNSIFLLTTMCGFVFSIILYMYVFNIFISHKFQPIFCSMTFPCAIGATSMINAAKYLHVNILKENANNLINLSHDFANTCMWFFGIVGIIFSVFASSIIFYILGRMMYLGGKTLFTSLKDNEFHHVYK